MTMEIRSVHSSGGERHWTHPAYWWGKADELRQLGELMRAAELKEIWFRQADRCQRMAERLETNPITRLVLEDRLNLNLDLMDDSP